jgi:hypothetical protein
MKKINAFHTLSTMNKTLNDEFNMRDFDILTMILSALYWRKNNGNIKLVADKQVISYLINKKLEFIWNEIQEIEDYDINRNMFWAGGKIFALKEQESPIVMLDTDMIVWNDISPKLKEKVVAIHDEPIILDIYKGKDYFKMKNNYVFNDSFDWTVYPSNTALLYIEDEEFKDFYCKESIRFMRSSQDDSDTLSYMVFAEQRLLSMCAKLKNINIGYMIQYPKDLGSQDDFTHLWGYKKALEYDESERKSFCRRCVKRILKEFPSESLLFVSEDFFYKYI